MKCIACGGTNLVEGTVPQTPKDDLKFYPGGRSFKDRMLPGGRTIRAYACLRCDHLQFAVNFEAADVEGHKEFDGAQPPLLERLADDNT